MSAEQPAPTAREIPADELAEAERVRIAEKIADAMGHERFDDAPECPDADGTMGCQHGGHPDLPGCDACGEIGWPCEPALRAAEAVLDVLGRERDVARAEVEAARVASKQIEEWWKSDRAEVERLRAEVKRQRAELVEFDGIAGELNAATEELKRLRARDEKATAVVQAAQVLLNALSEDDGYDHGFNSDATERAVRALSAALARAHEGGQKR